MPDEDRKFQIGYYRLINEDKLCWYRRSWTTENRITPNFEILADAEAIEFDRRIFYIGGIFTPLYKLASELEPERLLELKAKWVYARLTSRFGREVWLRHGVWHLGLDDNGKLIVPLEYQERQIIRFAHSHALYGQLTLDQIAQVMGNCKHYFGEIEEDLGGREAWECKKCGMGYAIDPVYTLNKTATHRAFQDHWPTEVKEAIAQFPGLIFPGIEGIAIGEPQQHYTPPYVPGLDNLLKKQTT